MIVTAVDTSVVVAGCLAWHADHARSDLALADALAKGRVVVPFTVIAQSYSVMTRMPASRRIPPDAARDALARTFARRAVVVAGSADGVWRLLDDAVACGAVGGGFHDFEILRTAAAAGATRLVTLNVEDFRRFGATGVEIVEP